MLPSTLTTITTGTKRPAASPPTIKYSANKNKKLFPPSTTRTKSKPNAIMNLIKLVSFHQVLFLCTIICSLVPKISELYAQILLHNPHLIPITDSWLKTSIPDSLIELRGYRLFRMDRRGFRGDGICIFCERNN